MGPIRFLLMTFILVMTALAHNLYFNIAANDREMVRLIEATRREVERGSWSEGKNHARAIRRRWEQKRPLLRFSIPLSAVHEISTEIALLEEALSIKDTNTAKMQTRKLGDLWKDLWLYK